MTSDQLLASSNRDSRNTAKLRHLLTQHFEPFKRPNEHFRHENRLIKLKADSVVMVCITPALTHVISQSPVVPNFE